MQVAGDYPLDRTSRRVLILKLFFFWRKVLQRIMLAVGLTKLLKFQK